jgi:1-aminocyclopropane-1-carboxylate deaminase
LVADCSARGPRERLVLDWVYPAKMMYGIYALAERGAFAPGTTLVALITG